MPRMKDYMQQPKMKLFSTKFNIYQKKEENINAIFYSFHMLHEGRPMIHYENMHKLLHFLDVKLSKNPLVKHVVGRCYLACMNWLSTKPNI